MLICQREEGNSTLATMDSAVTYPLEEEKVPAVSSLNETTTSFCRPLFPNRSPSPALPTTTTLLCSRGDHYVLSKTTSVPHLKTNRRRRRRHHHILQSSFSAAAIFSPSSTPSHFDCRSATDYNEEEYYGSCRSTCCWSAWTRAWWRQTASKRSRDSSGRNLTVGDFFGGSQGFRSRQILVKEEIWWSWWS